MNIDNKKTNQQNKKTSLGESIAQIKQTRKALEEKKTLLKINQIGKISQTDSTESKQEIAKAIKQLDELSAQL
ncbi:MAG: hypothetical protein L3J52_07450 [Proteobacteria bacterium]|nr:hypothetical protein [Pseudomonadota bacterium]